jgi:hypothetical protein
VHYLSWASILKERIGLDSTASLQVAHILKALTTLNITIVSVIHQPRVEIFDSFDDVLLLIPGGKTAYLGPVNQVVPYFEALGYVFPPQSNPADLIMDILSSKYEGCSIKHTPDELAQLWETQGKQSLQAKAMKPHSASSHGVEGTADPEAVHQQIQSLLKKKGARFDRQVWHNMTRGLLQQTRKMRSFWLEVFVGSAAGLLMGVSLVGAVDMYAGIWIPPYTPLSPSPLEYLVGLYGFLIGLACTLAAAPAGVSVFGEEKPVFWREAAAGHSRLAYYLAKSLAVVPRFTLAAFHFTSVYYFLARPLISFSIQFVLILLQFFGVYGMAVCVSLVVRRENAPLLAVIFGLFTAVFCGYGPSLVNAKDWGILFIWETSFNKWAAESQCLFSLIASVP